MPISDYGQLFTMEAANLFAGAQPGPANVSNHIRLTEVKLPGMDENYVDHRGAGAPVAIEIDTVFNRLDCTFTLAGWSPQVSALVDSWLVADNQFYMYGVIRDRLNATAYQAEAFLFGRLGRADPQNWRRGDVQHWAYAIRGITQYTLTLAGQSPIYQWDYYNSQFIVGGVDRLNLGIAGGASINAILHIPTTQAAGNPPLGVAAAGVVPGAQG